MFADIFHGPVPPIVLTGAKSFTTEPFDDPDLQARGLHRERIRLARAAAECRGASRRFLDIGLIVHRDFAGRDIAKDAAEVMRRVPPDVQKRPNNLVVPMRVSVLAAVLDAVERIVMAETGLSAVPEARQQMRANAFVQRAAIRGGDEQAVPHSDTFQPAVKWWWFPEAVEPGLGAFRYAEGSGAATEAMLGFHHDAANRIVRGDVEPWRGRGHAEGSLRFSGPELAGLGLACREIPVPADTLVIANVFGVHARGEATETVERIAMHGSIRLDRPFA